jgi:hypothetical protein
MQNIHAGNVRIPDTGVDMKRVYSSDSYRNKDESIWDIPVALQRECNGD